MLGRLLLLGVLLSTAPARAAVAIGDDVTERHIEGFGFSLEQTFHQPTRSCARHDKQPIAGMLGPTAGQALCAQTSQRTSARLRLGSSGDAPSSWHASGRGGRGAFRIAATRAVAALPGEILPDASVLEPAPLSDLAFEVTAIAASPLALPASELAGNLLKTAFPSIASAIVEVADIPPSPTPLPPAAWLFAAALAPVVLRRRRGAR